MAWNYEDQDPNKKVLMALQYAFEKCKNMVDIIFHVDGIFPFYDIIAEHMIENHFEGRVAKPMVDDHSIVFSVEPLGRNKWCQS